MQDAAQNEWLSRLDAVDLQDYEKAVEDIVQIAREAAQAEVGVLFLTADGIVLEAASCKRDEPNPPPASQLPTYRLHWDEQDPARLGGITAYVAVCREVVNLNQGEVFGHAAHKGRWDDVFLGGVRQRCTGILAVPIQTRVGAPRNQARVHGVLKVENPRKPDSFKRFTAEHQRALVALAEALARKLDCADDFWCRFVQKRALLKVSHLVELLERGRPIGRNLSQGLGYALHLLSAWLGCRCAVHVFWRDDPEPHVSLGRRRDFAKGQEPDAKDQEALRDEQVRRSLVAWLQANVGPEIVQPAKPISSDLWDVLFPNVPCGRLVVDIVRLKAGNYDLGAVLVPEAPLWQQPGEDPDAIKDTLTRLAINVVSLLGRFIEDEYEATRDTYLPEHRPVCVSKTCAILFADIRNFSRLTQVLRMMGKPAFIEPFLDHYCVRMGRVVGEAPYARVDKFLGDGMYALFGEYLDTCTGKDGGDEYGDRRANYKKVAVAVHCAFKMLEEFQELYRAWLTEGLSRTEVPYGLWYTPPDSADGAEHRPFQDLRRSFNEDVEIDLAIGVNIGEVFFDYFGDRTHREYTAIGDHVNFTQRLTAAARRYDEQSGQMRANILVSQTAYRCLDDHSYLLRRRSPIWLQMRGFGLTYPAYELEYEDLNHEKIAETVRTLEDKHKPRLRREA